MTRSNQITESSNAGELSPRLHARTAFSKYSAGLEICENLIPLAEGGLMRRACTRFVVELKSSTVLGRLKRFEFSTTQAYMLELGNKIMRFMRFQAQIVAANITASITNGTFDSNIDNWSDVSGGGGAVAHDSSNNRLELDPGGTAASDIASGEQQVTNSSALDHTLKFRVYGAPGDTIDLQVGTATGGTQILSPVKFQVGFHCYTFTTTAANFFVQFRSLGTYQNKAVGIDDVSFIDDSGIEIDTPYLEAQLFQVNGPQSADILRLFHPSHPAYKLIRNGHTSWSLVEVAWSDGPYLTENSTDTTLLPSANTGLGINLTLSSTEGVNDDQGWLSTDVGRLVRYQKGGSGAWGDAVIVSITTTKIAVADVRHDFQASPLAAKSFRLGAWSGTTGYPSVGAFYEQRLFAANTSNQPQTWWASQTADFENHTPDNRDDTNDGTVEDDDALDYTISADNVNAIRWMSPGEDTLAIGTAGGEWTPTSSGAVLTPSDVVVRRHTSHGSANIQPARVGSVVLFVPKSKRKVWEFGLGELSDRLEAFDMTRLAQHITFSGIVEMAYAGEPNFLVWAPRNDGQLLSMTFRRQEDVVGWARHIIGGDFYGSLAQVWQVDDTTFVDETTDANSSSNADWTVFPASEAVGDYMAIGHTEPFSKIIFDYANGTAGVGGTVEWEYWNGSSWSTLIGVTDNTTGFTVSVADNLTVTWTKPKDWSTRLLDSGKALYYVRAKITAVYTTNPILDQGFIPGDAIVESVAVIPGDDGTGTGQVQDSTSRDEVWVIVKRTIDGNTVRYIEVFERDYETGHDQEDAYYADSIFTYDGAATDTITGLDHLEGETVKIWADGSVHPERTVSGGSITLDASTYTVIQLGLGYTHKLKPLKVSAGTAAGTPVGRTKQFFGFTFVVVNSHTISFGPDEDNLQDADFREVSDVTDAAVPLFSGEKRFEFDDDWETDPRFIIQSSDPAPYMQLAVAYETDIKETR